MILKDVLVASVENCVSLETLSAVLGLKISLESLTVFQLYNSVNIEFRHFDLLGANVDYKVGHKFAIQISQIDIII